MWTFSANIRMQGDSGRILEQPFDELKKKATPKFKEGAGKRVEAYVAEREAWLKGAAKLAATKGKPNETNPHYLFAELDKLLNSEWLP